MSISSSNYIIGNFDHVLNFTTNKQQMSTSLSHWLESLIGQAASHDMRHAQFKIEVLCQKQ